MKAKIKTVTSCGGDGERRVWVNLEVADRTKGERKQLEDWCADDAPVVVAPDREER